jgi:hypothetical protein
LRKSDVQKEFKQDKTSSFDIDEDEEIIARIIEGFLSLKN